MNSLDNSSVSSKDTLTAEADDVVMVNSSPKMDSFENVERQDNAEDSGNGKEMENVEIEDESIVKIDESIQPVVQEVSNRFVYKLSSI